MLNAVSISTGEGLLSIESKRPPIGRGLLMVDAKRRRLDRKRSQ
jgi:hypothetical protein